MGWPKYRGTRGGRKKQERKWRAEGWRQDPHGQWHYWTQADLEEEAAEEEEREREESFEEPPRSRSPSRQSSNRSARYTADVEAAIEVALAEARAANKQEQQQRKELEERVRQLEAQLRNRGASAEASTAQASTYTAPSQAAPPAPFPETASQDSLVTVEVTASSSEGHSRHSSDQSVNSLHSRWSSGQSEQLTYPLEKVDEEVDYSPDKPEEETASAAGEVESAPTEAAKRPRDNRSAGKESSFRTSSKS